MARRRPARRASPHWFSSLLVGVVVGLGLVALGLWMSHSRIVPMPRTALAPAPSHRAAPPRRTRPPVPPASQPAPRPARTQPQAPRPETPPVPAQQPPASAPQPGPLTPGPATGRVRVAVIFDDAGYSLAAAREVMALGRPVTVSVLPHLPFSTAIAEEAAARGVQVILHLPVQPLDPAIPLGPGVVTVDMSDAAIDDTVRGDLASVPTAVGANNHEGSRGTADARVMRDV